MKKILSLLILACVTTAVYALPVKKLTVIYSEKAEEEEGIEIASQVQKAVETATGIKLPAKSDAATGKSVGPAIIIRHGGKDIFDYSLKNEGRNIILEGGCCWAMSEAAKILVENIKNGNIGKINISGNIYGKFLFPMADGANLRILDDNVWEYDKTSLPEPWKKQGIDCTNAVRHRKLAAVVLAWLPDVLALQECSAQMDSLLLKQVKDKGIVKLVTPQKGNNNFTPLYYNAGRLEPLYAHYNLYTPQRWSNHNTKSYTSAVFRIKGSGETFAVLNTHLWWKSDKAEQGSTQARLEQIKLCVHELDSLQKAYGQIPVFIMGDMNCGLKSSPMQELLHNGFVPVQNAATVSTDLRCGHHICGPKDGCSRVTRRKGNADDFYGAIDHFMVRDSTDRAEVKVFGRIQPYFTIEYTDHYPNYIDASIR